MRNRDIEFSRLMLANIRKEARAAKVKIPKKMTALKSGCGDWWLVEAQGGFRCEVCAHNAYHARYQAISKLIK